MTSLDLLSKYLLIMELRSDAMLYFNLGNENFDAGHIKCSRGPQVLHTWLQEFNERIFFRSPVVKSTEMTPLPTSKWRMMFWSVRKQMA